MCAPLSHYSINWRCCSWGLWWSSCSLPLRPINRRLSLHLFVCCICITGRASWWILSRLNGLLASNWWLSLILSLWMSCNASLFPMPSPTFTHYWAVIHQLSGRFSCKHPLLVFLLKYQHISVYSASERLESLPYTRMLLVNTTIEQFRTFWNGAAALRLAHNLRLLWSFIRSGDKGVVAQLLREMPGNDWTAQHMLCAVVGGVVMLIIIACVIVYVCCWASRWVYVIWALQADAGCWGGVLVVR